MTILEMILSSIVWLGYGAFAAYNTTLRRYDESKLGYYTIYMIFSPIVLIVKMFYGAFKKYHDYTYVKEEAE